MIANFNGSKLWIENGQAYSIDELNSRKSKLETIQSDISNHLTDSKAKLEDLQNDITENELKLASVNNELAGVNEILNRVNGVPEELVPEVVEIPSEDSVEVTETAGTEPEIIEESEELVNDSEKVKKPKFLKKIVLGK